LFYWIFDIYTTRWLIDKMKVELQYVFQYVLFELNRVDVPLVEKAYLILDIESNLKILSRKFYLVLTNKISTDSSLLEVV
jgi:hypothetical protein